MPYRRLPRTDQARIRSMKALVEMADRERDISEMPVDLKTLTAVRNFLPRFEAAQVYYTECFERQSKEGRKHQAHVRMARLYISHFIQVLNLAVLRAEIRRAHKEFYGLDAKNTVPDLTSETMLVKWGKQIIEGENKRVAQGGIPIYNPTIAKVKVHYDIFTESYHRQKNLQALTERSLSELAAMRPEADALILNVWDQVEKKFEFVSPNEKRLDLCRSYGLIYYYRTHEKLKMEERKQCPLFPNLSL